MQIADNENAEFQQFMEAVSAVDHLPGWFNRGVGVIALLALLAYLLWLGPHRRIIGVSEWRIALPDARSTLLQIAIGAMLVIWLFNLLFRRNASPQGR